MPSSYEIDKLVQNSNFSMTSTKNFKTNLSVQKLYLTDRSSFLYVFAKLMLKQTAIMFFAETKSHRSSWTQSTTLMHCVESIFPIKAAALL